MKAHKYICENMVIYVIYTFLMHLHPIHILVYVILEVPNMCDFLLLRFPAQHVGSSAQCTGTL